MKSRESIDERRNTIMSLREYGESIKDHKLDLAEEYTRRMSNFAERKSSENIQQSISIKKRNTLFGDLPANNNNSNPNNNSFNNNKNTK